MKPLRLYIQGFMCFDRAFIDLTQFSAALIVGRKDNNDHHSNGVGKTSIFKAIEYVLFNEADVNLEDVILDGAPFCQVVLDFLIGDQEYRLSRKRTKKGTTDLTLLQRNAQPGGQSEVYHTDDHFPFLDKKNTDNYWIDKSGSRTSDTEKDLAKLIKFTHKSFRSTVHFIHNDMTGLATVTPEKRKGILKEAFGLMIYPKLEKMAKDKASQILKDCEKHATLIAGLGSPQQDLQELSSRLAEIDRTLNIKQIELSNLEADIKSQNDLVSTLVEKHSQLESKFTSLVSQEKDLISEVSRGETSVKEYTSKCSNVVKVAKDIIAEINQLKDKQTKLATINYGQIDILTEQVDRNKEQIAQHNQMIKSNLLRYEELKVPLPEGSICQKCRKPMSNSEREDCQKHIDQDIASLRKEIENSKKTVIKLNAEVVSCQQTINSLNLSRQQLESINIRLTDKTREYQDKNQLHKDYREVFDKFKRESDEKKKQLLALQEELKNTSLKEANDLKDLILIEKQKEHTLLTKSKALHKEITHFSNNKAIVQHDIEQKNQDQVKKNNLSDALKELETKYAKFPSVIQGFSSTGIPNLIIQDVLDDLQLESNKLLSLLRPEMQLSFSVEKTTDDGEQADTLDIKYTVNGKKRYYEQLSGAMRLAVIFSLKLGLFFVLKNRVGIDIKFLLLDEIDQPLDKASVDAFAEIVKFFQQDFTILVITHNDWLKDKFSHAILVEQDINMISTAKVVSSW
jgi:DNA repair exonuclease SbcCD ATPase subunit